MKIKKQINKNKMNKKLFLLPLFGVIMAGCSSEDSVFNNENVDPVTSNYLTVSIIASNGTTRAGNDEVYESGTVAESYVEKVRFFFFDDNGKAVVVREMPAAGEESAKQLSYIDWVYSQGYPNDDTNNGNGSNTSETVEKILKATLTINTPENVSSPTKVLAVINPNADVIAIENPSLKDLQDVVKNFKNGVQDVVNEKEADSNKGQFVMSNSMYAEEGKTVEATTITPANYAPTPELAANNPLIIYVERVLARLDLYIGLTADEELGNKKIIAYPAYNDKEKTNNSYEIDGKQTKLYVKFLGWNIASTPNMSRLMKHINAEWTNQGVFGNSAIVWNTKDYHRSFWAINPDLTVNPGFEYQYNKFPNYSTDTENVYPISEDGKTKVYLQENVSPYAKSGVTDLEGPESPTIVVLAAQIIDEEGKPIEIAQWAGTKYTKEGLKKALADALNLYKQKDNSIEKIKPTDLDFKVVNDPSSENGKNYFVDVVLSKNVENDNWRIGRDGQEFSTSDAVNDYIKNSVNHVMVWNQGYSYYYFEVRHLGEKDSPGYYGIVRNHIYKATVSGLTGLGTPVYNPDVIYPETPDEESILSAEVRILQWRVVSNDYDLTW